jgi:hypothetical protein
MNPAAWAAAAVVLVVVALWIGVRWGYSAGFEAGRTAVPSVRLAVEAVDLLRELFSGRREYTVPTDWRDRVMGLLCRVDDMLNLPK